MIGGAGFVPFYPASNQGKMRYIGAPIVRYRGLRFRSDEEDSVKARLFRNPVYGIDVSFGGAFTANSSDIVVRRGMPDLDFVAEMGPRFYYFLYRGERLWWRLNFPVRAAFSTDVLNWEYQGLVFAPSTNLRWFFDEAKFNSLMVALTRTYTTHHLQELYFQVDQRFATPSRPEYDAKSGYMQSSLGVAYLHEKGKFGYYGGWEMNSFKGAANAGSPLFKANYNFSWFLGFSYFFYQSAERGYQ